MRMERDKQEAGIAILILDSTDFKKRTIERERRKDPALPLLGIYRKKPQTLN